MNIKGKGVMLAVSALGLILAGAGPALAQHGGGGGGGHGGGGGGHAGGGMQAAVQWDFMADPTRGAVLDLPAMATPQAIAAAHIAAAPLGQGGAAAIGT